MVVPGLSTTVCSVVHLTTHLGSSGLQSGGILMFSNNHVILRHVRYFWECFYPLHIPMKCHYSNCPEEKAEPLMGSLACGRQSQEAAHSLARTCARSMHTSSLSVPGFVSVREAWDCSSRLKVQEHPGEEERHVCHRRLGPGCPA